MPFDPNVPVPFAPLDADLVRNQLNSLKALIDTQGVIIATLQTELALTTATQVPIGGVIAWFKDTAGVPAVPANFEECNGQQLVGPASSLDGQLIPELNTGIQRFIRGGTVSGGTGCIDSFATAAEYK